MVKAFEDDLKYISSVVGKKDTLKKIEVYLAEGKSWEEHFKEPIKELMTERVTELEETFKKSRKQADLLTREWFNEYIIAFAQPINATTEESVRRLIEKGVNEGWSIKTVQDRLGLLFAQWMTGKLTPKEFEWFDSRMPELRREMIARTETIKALNAVSYRLYDSWGTKKKEWLATGDKRTRPDHVIADGQVVAIDKPFKVGGYEMMYPGDPAGAASQVVNCRCTVLPVIEE